MKRSERAVLLVAGKAESVTDHLLKSKVLAALGFGDGNQAQTVAADSYHRYLDDVKAAADLKVYRSPHW